MDRWSKIIYHTYRKGECLCEIAKKYEDYIIGLRRHFHENPEKHRGWRSGFCRGRGT